MINRHFCLALILSGTLLAQGCSKSNSNANLTDGAAQKPASEPALNQPSSAVAESNYKNRSTEYPAELPLPQYPGSQIEVSRKKTGKVNSYTVLLISKDGIRTVFSFYVKAYKDDGWDIGNVTKSKDYMMITARKNGRESNVMISSTRSASTAISIFVSKK